MLFNFFQTVGFYGFVAWTPTLLIAKGIHVTQSLEYSTIINVAAVIFPLLIMTFADKIERKWHACLSCLAHRRVRHLVRQRRQLVGADRSRRLPGDVGTVAVVTGCTTTRRSCIRRGSAPVASGSSTPGAGSAAF